MKDTYNPAVTYDAAVVLLGFINHRLHKNNRYFFGEQVNRALTGIDFVKSGHARILLIGNFVYKLDETRLFKKLAMEHGLKEDQIKIYGKVHRTLDEVKGVKDFAIKNSFKKILLITSESHMRRALALFKKQGLNPDVYSVNKARYKIHWKDFIPDPHGINLTNNCLGISA